MIPPPSTPRSLARLLWTALLAAVVLTTAGPVTAGPEGDAETQFAEARTRFDRGDPAGALPLFERALGASGSPNARLYVARCLRALGRTAAAYDEMHRTTRDATALADKDSRYVPTRDAAAAELALLEPEVGKLHIVWAGSTDAQITLDGQRLAAEQLDAAITVLPGEHVVIATPARGAAVEQKVRIDGGATKSVTLKPSQQTGSPAPASPAPDSGASKADEDGSWGAVRVAGVVVTGVGVAGMVLFAVAGSSAQSEFSTLEDECGSTRCTDPAYEDVIDGGKTWELVANVSLAVGITAIVGGAAMIIFGGSEKDAGEPGTATLGPTWELDFGPAPGGGTVGVHGTF